MSKEVKIIIDGKEIKAREGEKLLWVALDNGIYIPHLCAKRDAEKPDASCRLCFVEVEGMPNPVTSCTLPVKDGMVVRTRTPRVDRLVSTAFELLLSNHRLGCGKCPKNRSCELQTIAKERGLKLKLTRLRPLERDLPVDDSPQGFIYDPSRCVLCGQCVWVCHNKVGVGAIGFVRRGIERKMATFGEVPLAESRCTQCGECVEVCPVGALTKKEEDEKQAESA
ncbi:MAG: 4Fe-4S ferredoxin iron-sulfur binding domain protein [Thermoanaerobacterales bacterium 50_218]|nr:MAG: 4Fe-4S ferredoxin iron-sulfur binding domain protein [Thermoanaerobacterales bacterium 50_218]HAA90357.1 ferredoxin [Peptococcaceae bacterium]